MELYNYQGQMDAAPEEIFNIVNDDEKLKEWSSIFEGNEYFTEEKRAEGTKFRTKMKVLNKTYQFRSTITEYEENRYIKVDTTLKQGEIISEFKLRPETDNQTSVMVSSRFEAKSRRHSFILKGVKPVIKRVLDNQMKKLGNMASNH